MLCFPSNDEFVIWPIRNHLFEQKWLWSVLMCILDFRIIITINFHLTESLELFSLVLPLKLSVCVSSLLEVGYIFSEIEIHFFLNYSSLICVSICTFSSFVDIFEVLIYLSIFTLFMFQALGFENLSSTNKFRALFVEKKFAFMFIQ